MRAVVTGGAGFIGSNLAAHLLSTDSDVIVLEKFIRSGTRFNAEWLSTLGGRLEVIEADIRDNALLRRAIRNADTVYHLAAQVAVTTSVSDPRTDFDINALGTFNVLEAVRTEAPSALVVYSSTNKVYGRLDDIPVKKDGSRYAYAHHPQGISESQPLDFHSPYGCSKGTGDQYVRDYSRIYGLRTVVFRQSCVYGPRQFGNEDQGWVAHFVIEALKGRKITVFGDGAQVRDVLYVDDLISCFEAVRRHPDGAIGEIFNIGGGASNTLSLLELISYLERTLQRSVPHEFAEWRPGDQRVYVSDIAKARSVLGWKPVVNVDPGLDGMVRWVKAHLDQMP